MKKGFTLIELLVVIAIIGLLASIVLASLNSASNSAHDNSVKAGLRQLSSQLQLDATAGNFAVGVTQTLPYGTTLSTLTNGSYCSWWPIFSSPKEEQIMTNIMQNAQPGTNPVRCVIDVTGTKWAVAVTTLRGGGAWCVDNSGHFENQLLITSNAQPPLSPSPDSGMCP